MTKDFVIQRLENLSIFAEVKVIGEPDGGGVRLTFKIREMPPVVPVLGIAYTEENGFSVSSSKRDTTVVATPSSAAIAEAA